MFEIIYRDDWLVVIHKPSGMLVHKSDLDRRDQQVVLQSLSTQLGSHLYPVHRLDRATSGLLMFALSSEIARELQNAFQVQTIAKTYMAIVRGHLSGAGQIDHALSDKRDKRREGLDVSRREWPAKAAQTQYQGLLTAELPIPCGRYGSSRYSLVALFPKTGRRHQLRRHMKHCNHPILGDTTYGQGKHNRLFREHFQSNRLLLCATQLNLSHPHTKEPLQLCTRLDHDFCLVLNKLGWTKREIVKAMEISAASHAV
jgi:tRNA pseudouridine65 synthase